MRCCGKTHDGSRCVRMVCGKRKKCWQHGGKRKNIEKSKHSTKGSPKKDSQKMYSKEYHKWKISESILTDLVGELCEAYGNPGCRYEIRNILERFMMAVSQDHGDKIDRGSLDKMIEEFYEKRHRFSLERQEIDRKQIAKILDKYLIRHWKRRGEYKSRPVPKSIEFYPEGLRFDDDVSLRIGFRNLNILKQGIKDGKWSPTDVMLMVLRYKSHLIGGQQWGIPHAVYQDLYEKWGARYEAFASPLNSRMIGMKGAQFCSLFPDVDKIFGSLGNIFDVDMTNPLNLEEKPDRVVWVVNPPFVESIMEKIMDKTVEALKRADDQEMVVFVVLPSWKDSGAHKIIMDNTWFLRDAYTLDKNEHYFEGDDKIIARFKTDVFVMDTMIKKWEKEEGMSGETNHYDEAFDKFRV